VTIAQAQVNAASAPASRAPEFTTKLFTKEAVSIAGETECVPPVGACRAAAAANPLGARGWSRRVLLAQLGTHERRS